jgi:mono/diheme cytochrome c family protein
MTRPARLDFGSTAMGTAWPRLQRPVLWPIFALTLCGFAGAAAAEDAPNNQANSALGQKIFMEARCFACHGQFGFGGAGPRFRDDRYLGLTDYVVGQILMGRDIMPAFGTILSDDQVAAVATFIRNSWGNNFGPVQGQQVAGIRNDVKNRPPQGRPDLAPEPPSSGSPAPANPPPK